MVLPRWFSLARLALTDAHKRSSGAFTLGTETVALEFLGTTQVAVVKSRHKGRNFIPGDVVWVKKVAKDGTTLLEVQYFREGALGALRAFLLVHAVEGAKVEALNEVTNELPKNLTAYLREGSDGELPWALASHLAVLSSFSETPKGDFAFAQRQVRRMHSVLDIGGRPNRHCRVMGIESTLQRITKVSRERQKTKGAAALAAATLGEVLKDYEAFINNVTMFIKTKLDADTWNLKTRRSCKWLEGLIDKLSTWASGFYKMDLQPFTNDATTVGHKLIEASVAIHDALRNNDERELDDAQDALKEVLKIFESMLLRFETARALRVVSLAADERMEKFGIKVTEPNWLEINAIARRATTAWGVTDSIVISNLVVRDPQQAYTAFKEIVKVYDNASRAAA